MRWDELKPCEKCNKPVEYIRGFLVNQGTLKLREAFNEKYTDITIRELRANSKDIFMCRSCAFPRWPENIQQLWDSRESTAQNIRDILKNAEIDKIICVLEDRQKDIPQFYYNQLRLSFCRCFKNGEYIFTIPYEYFDLSRHNYLSNYFILPEIGLGKIDFRECNRITFPEFHGDYCTANYYCDVCPWYCTESLFCNEPGEEGEE